MWYIDIYFYSVGELAFDWEVTKSGLHHCHYSLEGTQLPNEWEFGACARNVWMEVGIDKRIIFFYSYCLLR